MIQIVGKATQIFNRSFSFHHKSEHQQLSHGIHCEIKFATWHQSLMSIYNPSWKAQEESIVLRLNFQFASLKRYDFIQIHWSTHLYLSVRDHILVPLKRNSKKIYVQNYSKSTSHISWFIAICLDRDVTNLFWRAWFCRLLIVSNPSVSCM